MLFLKTAVRAKLALMMLVYLPVAAAQTALSSEQILEQVSLSVATVLVGDGIGTSVRVSSAVAIRPDGVLLTAFHVVKDARELQVKFKSGDVYDNVQLLGADQRRDVAALRVSAGQLPTLPLVSLFRSASHAQCDAKTSTGENRQLHQLLGWH